MTLGTEVRSAGREVSVWGIDLEFGAKEIQMVWVIQTCDECN